MIELLMIIVRWLVGFQAVGQAVDRPKLAPVPFSVVRALRRGGYRALGPQPGIGWMTMRLDSVSCVHKLSCPSSARRGSMAWFITPLSGGV
jgi:hypothetical protein